MPYDKPLPTMTKEDRPFWEAAKQHKFMLPRCTECSHVWFPPYLNCQRCLSFEREWFEASGLGTVFGRIEMLQPYIPAFRDELPYNVVLVQLDEGPKMYSNLIDIKNEDIEVGMPVKVIFEDVTEEFSLPKFRPNR